VVTYYVVGAARRLGGWRTTMLNRPYVFEALLSDNEAQGRIPAPGLLWWSRAGVAVCAAAGLFVVWLLLRRAAGRAAAYGWLVLVLANPYLRDVSRRAMNEGVLLGVLAIVLWACERMLAAREGTDSPRCRAAWLGWLTAAGAATGLAAQVKLNAGSVLAGVAVLAVVSLTRRTSPVRAPPRLLATAAIVLCLSSAATFVAVDPTLWPNPPRHMVSAVRARGRLIRLQVDQRPAYAVSSWSERIALVPERVLGSYALVRPAVLNAMLFGAGFVAAAAMCRRWWRGEGANHALAVLAVIGIAAAAPPLFTPLDWPRYYCLPVFFGSLAVTLGGVTLARNLWARAK